MTIAKLSKIIALLLLVLLGVGTWYYFFGATKSSNSQQRDLTVRLGWVHQGQFAGMYIAKEKGFYADEGLTVDLLELDQTKNQVAELDRGEVDVSIMEAHQLLVGASEGLGIKAVMAVYQINPHVLASRADSGIDGPEDFNGKVVGFSGGEGEGNALFKVFAERFTDPDSVTYKSLGFDTVNNFINKDADIIDVYKIDQPFLAKRRGVPLTIISLDAYGFSTYGDVVAVSQRMINAEPDVVERFVTATRKGWEYALENPEEAVAITLPYTNGEYNDAEYQRHIIQQSIPLVRGEQSTLGRMELVSWSTLYESMRTAGALSSDVNIDDIYTNAFIR